MSVASWFTLPLASAPSNVARRVVIGFAYFPQKKSRSSVGAKPGNTGNVEADKRIVQWGFTAIDTLPTPPLSAPYKGEEYAPEASWNFWLDILSVEDA